MAFTDSIKWNGKSIRDFFAEITNVRGRGKPSIEVKSVAIPGRHGRIAFKQTYKPRIIEIEGTVEGVSHATLMSNIENLKSLFAMEDELLPPGDESITDGFNTGRLEFGDETDRHYNAVFDGLFELPEISHQWMSNDMKLFRARFRCDEPFAISNSLTEATMAGSANEFKIFTTGSVRSKPIIELSGAVTNPMLIEGDKVGVANFDYNDNLSDVTLSTISGNFTSAFGQRTRKSLASRQSKAVQIVDKDNLYYDRGSVVNGANYMNFNPYQGTIEMWVKPYWDGDDGLNHWIFEQRSDSNNFIKIAKNSGNTLFIEAKLGGTSKQAAVTVTSANFAAGSWIHLVFRWDVNNAITGSDHVRLTLNGSHTAADATGAPSIPAGLDATLSIGQDFNNTSSLLFDGLIHWQFFERALTDSEVAALYNSGAGVEPYVTPDTKLLSAGELSGGDPVCVQYPWANNEFGTNDGSMEDDPSAEWVASSAKVFIANNTSTVRYDLQSARLSWVSASTGDYLKFNTDALLNDQDYYYRFWLYVESLNASDELYLDIVGNSTVLTRRLDTGADDMAVSYGTGSWLYYEGCFEADGAVAHEFRIRKLNANGNAVVYVDQMDCQLNKINNSGFEGTYTAGLAPGWSLIGSTTVAEENSIVHSGTAAQKITASNADEGISQNLTLSADSWHSLAIWARGGSGGESLKLNSSGFTDIAFVTSTLTLTTTYKKYYLLFKTGSDTSGTLELTLPNGSGEVIYIDDASLIELNTVTANSGSEATSEIDSYSQEKFGHGLRIDGGDTLSWGITANKNEGTALCWIIPQFNAAWADDTDDPVIFELFYDANNYIQLSYDWTNDKFIFRKRVAGVNYDAEAGNQSFVKGEMLSVIGSYGPNGVKIYVNGVLGGLTSSNSASLTGNPGTLFLSDNTQTQFPDAVIDELYLLSGELSAAEVLKQSIQSKPVKNNNAKISLTKTLSDGDKLLIDSEKEAIEFVDSSANTFTNAIASMDSGSYFPNMDSNKSVLFNKVANAGLKLIYNKKWL